MPEPIPFNRVSISPIDYIGEAWGRVKGQYWMFLGITLVAMLLGGLAPMGVMLGPMMCGVYLCFKAQGRGEPVKFETLFKGFDRFLESFIAALLMMAASLVIVVPLILALVFSGLFLGFFAAMGASGGSREAQAGTMAAMVLLWVAAFLLIMLASVLINLLFVFTFPLIADRGLKGLEAVKLSLRAAWANIWGLAWLGLATFVLSLVGVCFCYVGAFLVMPITFGVHWITYERVFGLQAEA
ncbi:MAG: hypothetical protein IPQ13_00785 [Holophagaceae bacterium]|nr:hypothetical protein [Holophagaceae bacterium]